VSTIPSQQVDKDLIKKSIENADQLSRLVYARQITKEELRIMLGFKAKPSISPKKKKD